MALQEWTSIFKIKAKKLKQEDFWCLGFDENLVPDCPNMGWKQYIRNTCARFKCTKCGRGWPSNRVMVVFHMCLTRGIGFVKVRCFRQNCKMCDKAPMETPSISSENIDILLENLVEKIRMKCYHENLGRRNRPNISLDVKSPHEPAHCEACIQGICTRS
ncbi:receptor-transporting protein 3-like [Micropterus dolomieu]|uniref:receptor-transporting protein 3-like n=1 Tax=Micropterus dolomieu TaxID=147949 RepID=UPI001E8EBC5C|nr:receptor-transporting protein 3-like [Micropterus dolomieu]XP_045906550.1 receptor-transporting protein 3-like [Micropterus dolomieu]XP_045906553.1 receptor-transporting protein 3-like [Micropterus dolomieu]